MSIHKGQLLQRVGPAKPPPTGRARHYRPPASGLQDGSRVSVSPRRDDGRMNNALRHSRKLLPLRRLQDLFKSLVNGTTDALLRGRSTPRNETMPTPLAEAPRGQISSDPMRTLRSELGALADALVDAAPADRPQLFARVRHAEDVHRRCARSQDDLGRLLQHILADLSGDGAPLDTVYYARQIAVVADRLPN
jgi:hypothetical protein